MSSTGRKQNLCQCPKCAFQTTNAKWRVSVSEAVQEVSSDEAMEAVPKDRFPKNGVSKSSKAVSEDMDAKDEQVSNEEEDL